MSTNTTTTLPVNALPMGINLGITYGAYLIGTIVAAIPSNYVVFQPISQGPSYVQNLVILETHGLYHYLIVTFGNLAVLQIQVWSVQVEALIAYTIMLITQGFFITRIWELTHRQWLVPSTLIFFALAAFGSALTIVIKVFSFHFWSSSLLPYMKALVATNKSLETVADALIMVALCYYLQQGRSEIKRTNSMINKLMTFAVNRGAVTTYI
ncbi:hypothetical protein CPB84DRAFT_1855648 [Gymnopilus junonius]|uniref:DUF6534 domain-containing protein n=1 Tax=Gymnopilus junonius TaxID=109634 RepID=A0A9P5N731_GYMJU|nr:hypothetical protein CPB84DRAFT_1855648 [Gymnopilus junonius]